jgi:hypothetical protein
MVLEVLAEASMPVTCASSALQVEMIYATYRIGGTTVDTGFITGRRLSVYCQAILQFSASHICLPHLVFEEHSGVFWVGIGHSAVDELDGLGVFSKMSVKNPISSGCTISYHFTHLDCYFEDPSRGHTIPQGQ